MPKCSAGMIAALLAIAPAAAMAQGNAPAAQTPPAPQTFTLASSMQRGYQGAQRNLLEAAEKMPEADYAFKPTGDVRPFGQIVAHIALSQFGGCATLKGEKSPKTGEKEDATRNKAELIALLKESQAFCDPVLASITDENLTQLTKSGQNQVARGLFLYGNIVHANETYGVMTVYLRLKGIVPPTTERQNNARRGSSQ
jgi:uncharacterized damage-inducible protein DinB